MDDKYFEDHSVVKDDFVEKINNARKRDRYLNTNKAFRPDDIQKKKDAEMEEELEIKIVKGRR